MKWNKKYKRTKLNSFEIINKYQIDNHRIINILTQILAEPLFTKIRLASLSNKIFLNHESIIQLFKIQNRKLNINSNLTAKDIIQLKEILLKDVVSLILLNEFKDKKNQKKKIKKYSVRSISTPM